MEIKILPSDEGLKYLTSRIKSSFIAECSKVNSSAMSQGIFHHVVNGKPYYMSANMLANIQSALILIGTQLMTTNVTPDVQTKDESPYCYGDDYISKFKVLGKVIKLPFLFRDTMGRTEKWQKMHLSAKEEFRYYNKFSESELEEINNAIHSIALDILSVRLAYQERDKTEV